VGSSFLKKSPWQPKGAVDSRDDSMERAFLRLGDILADIADSSRQSEPKESPLGVARSSRKHSKNRSCKGQLENEKTTAVHMFAVEAGIRQTVQKGVGGLPQEGTTHICRYDKG